MSSGPSDFERGVLAAAQWMRANGLLLDTLRMLEEMPKDTEGTEARVVKEIAVWIRERASFRTNTLASTTLLRLMADGVEAGDWRPK